VSKRGQAVAGYWRWPASRALFSGNDYNYISKLFILMCRINSPGPLTDVAQTNNNNNNKQP
jgi:hypothetical protein